MGEGGMQEWDAIGSTRCVGSGVCTSRRWWRYAASGATLIGIPGGGSAMSCAPLCSTTMVLLAAASAAVQRAAARPSTTLRRPTRGGLPNAAERTTSPVATGHREQLPRSRSHTSSAKPLATESPTTTSRRPARQRRISGAHRARRPPHPNGTQTRAALNDVAPPPPVPQWW